MTETGVVAKAQAGGSRVLVQIAGFIFYLLAVQALLTAGVGLNVYFAGGAPSDLLLPGASAFLAVCYAVIGYFLRRYRVWARNFAVAFAFSTLSLFAFPIGTLLGVFVVLCIGRAHYDRVFAQKRPEPSPAVSLAMEEDAPVLRFEPELATEHAG